MIFLIKAELMYGGLSEVNSAVLVERYSRALKHLIDKETELTEFHIDISGYAPERSGALRTHSEVRVRTHRYTRLPRT